MIKLRPYQEKARAAFFEHNEVGLFEMATGTGKTFTSLACVAEDFKQYQRQFLVIVVPYLHLVDQWKKDLPLFGIDTVITVAHSKQSWYPILKNMIWNYKHHFCQRVVVIGSYDSLAKEECRYLFQNIDHSFLLADECHNIGKPSYSNHPLQYFKKRLGISATPKRWQDEYGTNQVHQFFGEVIYQFTMEEAIKNGFLTPYDYYPVIVGLTEQEEKEFSILTKKIARLLTYKEQNEESIKQLSIKRGRILKRADLKFEKLYELLEKQNDYRYTLIYCAEGDVDKIVSLLSPLNIKMHRFTSEVSPSEREVVLQQFANGDIEVLIAIKCLDEGVDVPATRTAYFLASTSNPREFIQRRGRVLRQSPGKNRALIYDFVVLPQTDDESLFQKIARKECPRCVEFTNFANNKYMARSQLYDALSNYGLEFYLELDSEGMQQYIEQQRKEY